MNNSKLLKTSNEDKRISVDMRDNVVMELVTDNVVGVRGDVKKTFKTTSVKERKLQYEKV